MLYGWSYNRVKSCKYSQVEEKKIRFLIKKKKKLLKIPLKLIK